MRKVTKIVTNDGREHDSYDEAVKYLDDRYGRKLTSLAHRMANLQRYSVVLEFLNENLSDFEELIKLRTEMSEPVEEEES